MLFKDLKTQYEVLREEIDTRIQSVLNRSAFILGREVEELEERLAGYVGRKHCVTCASGSDALMLAMMAWGIGPGDAIIVPDFTFAATAGAASVLGAAPVFTDIDPETFTMDPGSLEKTILQLLREGRLIPKVIIPVDLFGLPADYDRILPIADKYRLKVLEDGAQGFGGSIRGKRACSFGDISVTSFFPAKPLGCYGDGGALFTDDDEADALLRSLRAQGRSPEDKYESVRTGINSRLDTLQAAVLLAKLTVFEDYELAQTDLIAKHYSSRLRHRFRTPLVPNGFASSWAQYTILLSGGEERDLMREKLKEQEIPSMIYYPRGLHSMKAYDKPGYSDEQFPNTCSIAARCLSLPIHPYMKTEDVDRVCAILLDEPAGG